MSPAAMSAARIASQDGARSDRPAAAASAPKPAQQLPIGTLPQPYYTIGHHAVVLGLNKDEQARLDFVSHLKHFMAQGIVPSMRTRFEAATTATPPANRAEAWSLLQSDPMFPIWSHLRRRSMEMRQRRNLDSVLGQCEHLAEAARAAQDWDESAPLRRRHGCSRHD